MRRSYPEIRARNAELIEVGPNLPANAVRAFRHYLGDRELEFPYLCDPGWTVHARYGLRNVGPELRPEMLSPSVLKRIARQRSVPPVDLETSQLRANPMQQGLFVVDEAGLVRYAYVTEPTGPLPPAATLFGVLDSLPG